MSPSNALIQLSIDSNSIAYLKMQDVAGKNALSAPFIEELMPVLEELKNNPAIKVVLMSGTSDIPK